MVLVGAVVDAVTVLARSVVTVLRVLVHALQLRGSARLQVRLLVQCHRQRRGRLCRRFERMGRLMDRNNRSCIYLLTPMRS